MSMVIKNMTNRLKRIPEEKMIALKLVVIYGIMSELLILVSDECISLMVSDINVITIQMIKARIYVMITSYLLYLFICKNLIKIKKLKKDLHVSEKCYEFFVNNTTEGLWDWKIQTGQNVYPVKWKSKLGYEEHEIPDTIQGWIKLLHPDEIDWVFKGVQDYIYKKVPRYNLEYRIKKKNGEWIWISDRGQAIWDESGNPIRMIGTHTDITQRKKSEYARKKMMEENKKLLDKTIENDRLKTEFFCNISHEFKTPLNVILGTVQLLTTYKDDLEIKIDSKKFNKYIHIMKQNCNRLLRLINNLIDINKIDSGFVDINYKNHNIINMIEEITLSVLQYAGNKGLSIIFDTEIEEKIIACDAEKIERIMLNILSNAIKYTKSGGNIYINIYDQEDYIIISVKDTGVGISQDKLEIIFERFEQVDSTLRRLNEGSGIGLSLVKSLVQKHEGEIWVESEPGIGSEFFIKLPVRVLTEENKELSHDHYEFNLVEKIKVEFSDIYSIC